MELRFDLKSENSTLSRFESWKAWRTLNGNERKKNRNLSAIKVSYRHPLVSIRTRILRTDTRRGKKIDSLPRDQGRRSIPEIVIQISGNDFHPESIPKVPWEWSFIVAQYRGVSAPRDTRRRTTSAVPDDTNRAGIPSRVCAQAGTLHATLFSPLLIWRGLTYLRLIILLIHG